MTVKAWREQLKLPALTLKSLAASRERNRTSRVMGMI